MYGTFTYMWFIFLQLQANILYMDPMGYIIVYTHIFWSQLEFQPFPGRTTQQSMA